ncbi:MAG: hypothetical protein WC775_01025 [Patescibacteria group bacterium]|jgi:hypothetical protein
MTSLPTFTKSLIEAITGITEKKTADDLEAVDVSKTVSFFALIYEKIRNVIEFKDEHIVRRNAINRIVNRRLVFNPNLTDEGLSIAKEIAWAGYYKGDKIPETKITQLENAVSWYTSLRQNLVRGESGANAKYYAGFIRDLLVCQIEEIFAEKEFQLIRTFLFYFYQVLNPNIIIQGEEKNNKDLTFYVACEQVFLKSDKPYLRFHLFKLLFEDYLKVKEKDMVTKLPDFKKAFKYIDKQIDRPINRKIFRYLRNQRPAYLVLKELVLTHAHELSTLFDDEEKLNATIDALCREKYEASREKLKRAGVRSFLYILCTKMIFVIVLEYPIMVAAGGLNLVALGINAALPPVLMALFVLLVSLPNEENTKKIIERIGQVVYGREIVDVTFKVSRYRPRSFFSTAAFWTFYLLTFAVTYLGIDLILDVFEFEWFSKIVFFFFITAVSFFGYRVRQMAMEYTIKEKESILTPVVDFFMIPLISVGKWLSSEISRINVLIFVFDFIIEAPFKVLFEVIEEWIHFVNRRKEDIV